MCRIRETLDLRNLTKRLLRIGLCVIIALLLVLAALWFWYTHRPLPDPVQQVLFEGVTFVRDVRSEPRPLIIYVVTVELDVPGIAFLVTPGNPTQDQPLQARKTSQFLAEFGVHVAVNGDFCSLAFQIQDWSTQEFDVTIGSPSTHATPSSIDRW